MQDLSSMFQYSAAPDPPPLRCENNRAATPGTAMAYRHYADRIKQHHQSTTTSGHHSAGRAGRPREWTCATDYGARTASSVTAGTDKISITISSLSDERETRHRLDAKNFAKIFRFPVTSNL
jgi:predicted secreted Zn-dependent protease